MANSRLIIGAAGLTPLIPVQNARVTIWGQSNALGRADRADINASPINVDAELEAYNSGALSFDRVRYWTGSSYVTYSPSIEPYVTAGQFGSEFGLAVRWMRETAAGVLYIDKTASSGVSITTFAPVTSNFAAGLNRYNAATSWLSTNSVSITARGFIWVQGETDYLQTQEWYQDRLTTMMAARVSNGLQAANTPTVIAQMHPSTVNYGAGVAAAKAAWVAGASGAVALQMPYYMKSDNLHQNGRGQVQMGYDYFSALFGAPALET